MFAGPFNRCLAWPKTALKKVSEHQENCFFCQTAFFRFPKSAPGDGKHQSFKGASSAALISQSVDADTAAKLKTPVLRVSLCYRTQTRIRMPNNLSNSCNSFSECPLFSCNPSLLPLLKELLVIPSRVPISKISGSPPHAAKQVARLSSDTTAETLQSTPLAKEWKA